jgi:2-keto-4-pentenoate hydratase/2-oxohepta-3-ene-1,7-dioic acid hydratase in catechol pathway
LRLARFIHDGKVYSGIVEGGGEGEDGVVYGFAEAGFFNEPAADLTKTGDFWELKSVKLIAPVAPSKIVAIGLNFKAHAAEFDKELPDEPMIFLKPSTSVIGPGEDIIYPSHMSRRVDYEGELGAVIGRTAKDVEKSECGDYILGYTCFNDVTARDLQGRDVQYTRAKGFDTFAPMGPWIETELDPTDVRIRSFLNGEKKQDTSTSDMIFDVFDLVSFVSHVMTLLPGDIIATGTPSGVGKMKPGDTVEVRIDGIGSLVNTVAAR